MSLNVCPAAVVAAPIEIVWELAQPMHFSEWADGQVEQLEPEGPIVMGQTAHIVSQAFGRRWQVTMTVEKLNVERHQFGMYGVFPFGLRMHEFISCAPLDAVSCRVQYG